MRKNHRFGWLLLLTGLIVINVVAAIVHRRFDLTADKRYSLSQPTRELVQKLEEPVNITVFLQGDLPSTFRQLSNSTEEFLNVLRDNSNAKINYRFVAPDGEAEPGRTWGDSLSASGAGPVNVNVQLKAGQESKLVYPYALVQHKEGAQLVNLFETSKRSPDASDLNIAESMLEYQFVKAITRLQNPQLPFVAYATGNGEPTDARTYDLQQTIGSNYRLFLFNLATQPSIPDTIKTLVIVKPSEAFSNEEKLKLDQYLMRGGNILWFVDGLNAEEDSLRIKDELIAYDRNLNLQDLFFHYGVRINPDLIMDLQCDFLPFAVGGTPEKPQFEFLKWNYYPLFESRGNHIINKSMGLVAGRFVNSIDTVGAPGVRKTFLLQSSNNSRTINTPARISPDENRNAAEDALFKKEGIPAAVLLEGKFSSFFKSRISRAQMDSLQGGFRETSTGTGKMIVVADGDIVLNDVSNKQGPLPMGTNLFTVGSQYEYSFANRDFLLNCLEYLNSDASLIATRNKEIVLRLLDTKKAENEKLKWQLITIALPVLLVVVAGFAYGFWRRKKYAASGLRSSNGK
jgi:ABC-2 type transport system permease protein